MGLAFWRSGKRAGNAAAKPATRPPTPADDDDPRVDPAATLRARARHRLIGASALLLAVAIVVPMLLDREPRPVPENIPIDIPSERTPFTPRLSLPPVPAADAAATPPPDQAPKTEAKSEARPAPKAETKVDPKAEIRADARADPKPDDAAARAAEEQRALAALEGKTVEAGPAMVKSGKFAVQTAAPANEKSAREQVERLRKSGFTAYTEKVDAKDGTRYRVRVGPYATRDDAERARARLKSQGFGGNLVAL
jgi:DedD protein